MIRASMIQASSTLLALLSSVAFGQSGPTATAARPSFEIAQIRKSAHVTNPYMRGGTLRGSRYDVRTASMVELIANAYGVESDKVQGGPAWLDINHYDISAKAPEKTPSASVKLMLQSLLEDRFGLKIHPDKKAMSVYVRSLPTGGESKLKESESSNMSCQGEPQNPPPPVPINVIKCTGMTMDQIASALRNFGGNYLSFPTVNQTGIEGTFDFTLRWTPRQALSAAGADGISIFDAVDKQLGLKLEAGKAPVPVMVVDSVNELPAPDPPGVTAALPAPPPAEFEVAIIKPSNPDGGQPSARVEHGRVEAHNLTLKNIITFVWDMNSDDLLANAPKFLDSAKFDILAKAPAPAPGDELDDDELRIMVRKLLAERFNLKTHMEERPVDGYVLTVVKPKLVKADPSNRTNCHEGPGADGKDPRDVNPILGRLMTCQNMTMAQFVEQLPNLANGYAHVDVLDQTGLTEAYDFTLSFSTIGQVQGNGPGQPGGPGQSVSDPNGAISLPEAISKTLGLKLELKKRPMQVLVIDHIDEMPTEN